MFNRSALDSFYNTHLLGQYFEAVGEDMVLDDYLWAYAIATSRSMHL